jgi:hypothetical protein
MDGVIIFVIIVPHMVGVFNGKSYGKTIIESGDGARGIVDDLRPLFEFVVEKEVRIRLLVNPLAKIIDLALFHNFACASGTRTAVPSVAVDIIEKLGKARGVVGGEVFDYFQVSHLLFSFPIASLTISLLEIIDANTSFIPEPQRGHVALPLTTAVYSSTGVI